LRPAREAQNARARAGLRERNDSSRSSSLSCVVAPRGLTVAPARRHRQNTHAAAFSFQLPERSLDRLVQSLAVVFNMPVHVRLNPRLADMSEHASRTLFTNDLLSGAPEAMVTTALIAGGVGL
jgi:hypothetical protein